MVEKRRNEVSERKREFYVDSPEQRLPVRRRPSQLPKLDTVLHGV